MLNSPAFGGLGQTIAIMDQSGKMMTTSRHLMNILSDVKHAYRERKAEMNAARNAAAPNSPRPPAPRRSHTIDEQSVGSRRSHRSHRHHHHSGSKSQAASRRASGANSPRMRGGVDDDAAQHGSSSTPVSPAVGTPKSPFPPSPGAGGMPPSLVPYEPEMGVARRASLPVVPKRQPSEEEIDPNLAYGEIPPGLFEQEREDEAALKGLVGRARGLLDEANCLQHGVSATVQKLQKDPDAMAAVALTLAEISSLVKKMAPGALLQVRSMAPAVFALLSSPQFLVAVGVGVGVTIVALGGYKIVRRIQEKRGENDAEEMIQLQADVSRIETWRRGVAESEADSVGTSVEGEFISPTAARLKALNLAAGDDDDSKSKSKSKSRSHRARASTVRSKGATRSARAPSSAGSAAKSRTSGRSGSVKGASVAGKDDEKSSKHKRQPSGSEAKPKPSPLRLMFK